MKRFLKIVLSAGVVTVAAGAVHAFADDHEVANIWWDIEDNYNGSDQKACVAENYNDYAVDAIFDVYPTSFDFEGNPTSGRAILTMRPYTTYKLYGWPDHAGADPSCALRSYKAHVP